MSSELAALRIKILGGASFDISAPLEVCLSLLLCVAAALQMQATVGRLKALIREAKVCCDSLKL